MFIISFKYNARPSIKNLRYVTKWGMLAGRHVGRHCPDSGDHYFGQILCADMLSYRGFNEVAKI